MFGDRDTTRLVWVGGDNTSRIIQECIARPFPDLTLPCWRFFLFFFCFFLTQALFLMRVLDFYVRNTESLICRSVKDIQGFRKKCERCSTRFQELFNGCSRTRIVADFEKMPNVVSLCLFKDCQGF